VDDSLGFLLYADRALARENDTITVFLWLPSAAFDSVSVSATVPADLLEPACPLNAKFSPGSDTTLTFKTVARKPGEPNLYANILVFDGKATRWLATAPRPLTLHIEAGPSLGTQVLSHSLFGVVVGALLALLSAVSTLALSERRKQREEMARQRRWRTSDLPAALQLMNAQITKRQPIANIGTLEKILSEGYYAGVRAFQSNVAGGADLASALLDIRVALQEYEHLRMLGRLDASVVGALQQKLNLVIKVLD